MSGEQAGEPRESRQQLWSAMVACVLALWMLIAGVALIFSGRGTPEVRALLGLVPAALSIGGLLCWRDPPRLWQAAPYVLLAALMGLGQVNLWACLISAALATSAGIRVLRHRTDSRHQYQDHDRS